MTEAQDPHDNSDNRRTEESNAEDFRWRAWFQRSSEPIFVLNRLRQVVFVNRAWETLTGIPLAQARRLACRHKRTITADDDRGHILEHVLRPPEEVLGGKPGWTRRPVPGLPDNLRWWDIAFLPFKGPAGLLFILGRVTVAETTILSPATPVPEVAFALREIVNRRYNLESLASDLPVQSRVAEQVRLAAGVRVPVLLLGEPGTGKRWTARTIHALSRASGRPLVVLDCARLPSEVIAGILFSEGNLVSRVDAGSLYLREPSHLPRELQVRLCHILAAQDESHIGAGPGWLPRVLTGCATDPAADVRSGRLLDELYCRLSPLQIRLPPLRERREDLPRLVPAMLELAAELAEQRVTVLTTAAWDALRTHTWPGNLAELFHVLVLASRHAEGSRIDLGDLPLYLRLDRKTAATVEKPLPLKTLLEQVERRLIALALRKTGGNKSRTADLLTIWRPLLLRRMEALGLGDKRKTEKDAETPKHADTEEEPVSLSVPGRRRVSASFSEMRSPQLLIYETEAWIADLLRGTAGTWKWALRELRQDRACLRSLRQGGPCILVLELGRDLEHDLKLLEQISRLCPETATVVVARSADSRLMALAWDLGAACVLAPPQPRDAVLPVVLRLMETVPVEGAVQEPHVHE
jgi:DNA-binding NtrC family response regulator